MPRGHIHSELHSDGAHNVSRTSLIRTKTCVGVISLQSCATPCSVHCHTPPIIPQSHTHTVLMRSCCFNPSSTNAFVFSNCAGATKFSILTASTTSGSHATMRTRGGRWPQGEHRGECRTARAGPECWLPNKIACHHTSAAIHWPGKRSASTEGVWRR